LFHAVYWPAFLWSAGLDLPRRLVVNGWLTVEGRKISKSDPDTIVDPLSLIDSISSDGLKYYFLKTVRLGQDLDFQQSHLVELLNADLANNVGNLFSRFVKLFAKHFPQGLAQDPLKLSAANNELRLAVGEKADAFEQAIENYEVSLAARIFIDTAGLINASIQQSEPWKNDDKFELSEYLWTLHHCLADLTILGASFVPELIEKARTSLNLGKNATWQDLGCNSSEVSVGSIDALFPRI